MWAVLPLSLEEVGLDYIKKVAEYELGSKASSQFSVVSALTPSDDVRCNRPLSPKAVFGHGVV